MRALLWARNGLHFLIWGSDFRGSVKSECSLLSCIRLWDPMDCSPPGSSVHGILQAGILEWVVIIFSRGSSWPRDWTCPHSPSFPYLLPPSRQCQRVSFVGSPKGQSCKRFLPRLELDSKGAFPWWSSGWDATLPMQGVWVRSLVRELDLEWHD